MLDPKITYCTLHLMQLGPENFNEIWEYVTSAQNIQTLLFALDSLGYGLYSNVLNEYVSYDDLDEERDIIKLGFDQTTEDFSVSRAKAELTIKEYPSL